MLTCTLMRLLDLCLVMLFRSVFIRHFDHSPVPSFFCMTISPSAIHCGRSMAPQAPSPWVVVRGPTRKVSRSSWWMWFGSSTSNGSQSHMTNRESIGDRRKDRRYGSTSTFISTPFSLIVYRHRIASYALPLCAAPPRLQQLTVRWLQWAGHWRCKRALTSTLCTESCRCLDARTTAARRARSSTLCPAQNRILSSSWRH